MLMGDSNQDDNLAEAEVEDKFEMNDEEIWIRKGEGNSSHQ